MGLYLDVVNNHVLRQRTGHGHPEWFHGKGDILDWNDPVQVETRCSWPPDLDQVPGSRLVDEGGPSLGVKVRPQGFELMPYATSRRRLARLR